ncbi:hypothetical protein Aperf_G00000013527 [Anoplocephala perfoliata]
MSYDYETKNGLLKRLFNPLSFLHGMEEAANNYARGRFILGGQLIDSVINRIRREAETTDRIGGFIVNHSIGGGTGSGFTVRLMDHLTNEYGKALTIQFPIFPSEYLSTTVVDPYNAILHCGTNVSNSKMIVMMDNLAIMGLLSRYLHIEKPTFVFLNRLIAQLQSNFFVGFHYTLDPICNTIEEVLTNLIPFPQLHYLYVRNAPIVSALSRDYLTHTTSPEEVIRAVLKPQYNMLSADKFTRSKIITTVLSFRGRPSGWQQNLASCLQRARVNQSLNIVEWCPTGVKIAIHAVPPLKPVPDSCFTETPLNLTMVINGTATTERTLERINAQFTRLYERRCFVHWFVGEGMEETEFQEASEAVKGIIREYHNAETADVFGGEETSS